MNKYYCVMKTTCIKWVLLSLIFPAALSLLDSCTEREEVHFEDVSVIQTETSATISWTTSHASYQAAEVKLFLEEDQSPVDARDVPGASKQSVTFENLQGLTAYAYEITLTGASQAVSHSGTFQTSYASRPMSLITRDSLHLVGEFNDWDPTATPMPRRKSVYRVQIELEPGQEYQFRYLLDGQEWFNDPQADGYVMGGHGAENGVLTTPTA